MVDKAVLIDAWAMVCRFGAGFMFDGIIICYGLRWCKGPNAVYPLSCPFREGNALLFGNLSSSKEKEQASLTLCIEC